MPKSAERNVKRMNRDFLIVCCANAAHVYTTTAPLLASDHCKWLRWYFAFRRFLFFVFMANIGIIAHFSSLFLCISCRNEVENITEQWPPSRFTFFFLNWESFIGHCVCCVEMWIMNVCARYSYLWCVFSCDWCRTIIFDWFGSLI